jgi:ubiquinone/menaquinone biosynthesis C-methylase UbiE
MAADDSCRPAAVPTGARDWSPVAPSWERKPEHGDLWRRVATLPALALNRVELELLGPVAGRTTLVLGAGDGLAALALAALGARVLVADASSSLLDVLLVRTQLLGLNIAYRQVDTTELDTLPPESTRLVYAAHLAPRTRQLDRAYRDVHRLLEPGGRVVVTEYHPVRRIWKPEPGAPRAATSYFERCRERLEVDGASSHVPGSELARHDYQWTVSDQFHYLTAAGLRVVALEEVGEVRQDWELPNLRGLPEQLVLAADKPADRDAGPAGPAAGAV